MSEFNIAKVRRLDGGLLLVYNELIDCRNAKETARRLSVSESAISHSLGRLRDLLGDPLFVRKPHGLEPTQRTLELSPVVRELLGLTSVLLGTRQAFDPATAMRLFTISAPDYIASRIAAPLINDWRQRAPRMFLQYKQLAPSDAIADIRRGALDLAIGRFDERLPPGVSAAALYEDGYCVVARVGHPRVNGSVTPAQYVAEAHVFANDPSEVTVGESNDVPEIPAAAIVGNWTTALAIAAMTDSLVTCHRALAQHHAALLGLQVLPTPFVPTPFVVALVHRSEPNTAVTWLRDEVVAQVQGR